MFSVVFVCSGNTCRSPLAELIGRREFARLGAGVDVGSAGLAASDGAGASNHAQFVARDHGGDLGSHRSRAATRKILEQADLVLTMTGRHRDELLARFSPIEAEVATLAELAGEEGVEVEDPFGGSLDHYERTYEEIERLVRASLPALRRRLEAKRTAS
jgi:protein-tyrosine-phosphatase